ncbi:uncharacterized protein PAC_13425 [Phialocephala subalpina]|uniref:Uncharacterized protein n=1 Tax=Phialocephala subalpina TaxID=576137 RepID=A0A1L7XET9_9HELO|nr:uncharacterized protein PAC_13425 [Phialocephala subalpina]
MLKRLGSPFGRAFGRQKSKVGDSSAESTSKIADPTIRLDTTSTAQQTVDLYSTEGPIGIRVVADPTDATLDIVFVHGLTGNRDKTWTHTNDFFWPLELAKDIPTARIMTFGYDADVVKLWGIAGSNNLRNHGKSLASDASDLRRGYRDRPIIFIAHSLGGLVCEQALLICREGEPNLEKVFHATKGIIFMGTPHGGADLANWGYTLATYLNIVRRTNSAILGDLRQKSEVLTAVQQQFQQLLRKPGVDIGIYCFFEEKAVVGLGIIVSEQSAVLHGYSNQAIPANHMDMTKFSGKNDAGYRRVLNRLRDLMELMDSATATDMGQEPIGSGQTSPRVGNLGPTTTSAPRVGVHSQTLNQSNTGSGSAFGNVQGNVHIHPESDPRLEKETKCQQLLRTSDYERYKDRNPCPVQGTCQWFLRHTNYINWRDSLTSSLLWISADPGCGKSVLSKFLADQELQVTKDRTICYFFFKDDNEDQKTTTNALCALLHQLFGKKNELLKYALEVHNCNGDKFTASVDLLWEILITASADPKAKEIICVLDALDECRQSELEYLLRKVCAFYEGHRIPDKTALKFLVTSRPLQRIVDQFSDLAQGLPTIRLAGEEDIDQIKREIDLVIQDELGKIQRRWRLDQATISVLQGELAKVEHRTYLWLKLIFELIRKDAQSVTKRGRLKIFGTIPDSVDAAYTAILNQSTDKEQAKKLLQIVCIAVRPLSVKEMSIALSIQEDDKALSDLEVQSEEYSKNLIRNLCGLFVSVIDGRVYLLHQTAKEFLIGRKELTQSTSTTAGWIWKHTLSVQHSNFVLAHICMWYLRLEGFSVEETSTNIQDENNSDDNSDDDEYYEDDNEFQMKAKNLKFRYDFLKYSAINWAVHFREAMIPKGDNLIALALDICSPQAYPYTIWSLIYWANEGFLEPPSRLISLHLASQFGHQGVVSQLLAAPGIEVNEADKNGWTPLYRAASEGHAAIVSQLLAAPGIEVNAADKDGWTPLYSVALEGHTAIVSQLLTAPGIEVNAATKYGWTPLYNAASRGHTAIVGQLLAAPGIEVNAADKDGWTPLYRAASRGHTAIVGQLLAAPGIEVNAADKDGWTPLYNAASRGHTAIVGQLLAAPGIEVNLASKNSWTPLHNAASGGHTAIVGQLLAAPGIEVNVINSQGETPLRIAQQSDFKDIIKLLLPLILAST